MLENKLLGIPLVVWGIVCLALTIVWVLVWPSERVAVASGLRFVILRWFHALTWLLLAVAAFLAALSSGGAGRARPVAQLALVVYLVFMATFIGSSTQ
ncbi:MAG: hypothetical protein H0T53_02240 [Herpetosiphonaceae bacterium]|nr:hypothetical protein [Herpetosiphonaceae bacterium]